MLCVLRLYACCRKGAIGEFACLERSDLRFRVRQVPQRLACNCANCPDRGGTSAAATLGKTEFGVDDVNTQLKTIQVVAESAGRYSNIFGSLRGDAIALPWFLAVSGIENLTNCLSSCQKDYL
jgi:hypothetical protein